VYHPVPSTITSIDLPVFCPEAAKSTPEAPTSRSCDIYGGRLRNYGVKVASDWFPLREVHSGKLSCIRGDLRPSFLRINATDPIVSSL